MLLIMEQAKGTRYEGLRASLIDMLAAKTAPMLADEDNSMLLAQIMARNLIDGMVMVLKNRVRPREIRTNLNRLVEYHTKGMGCAAEVTAAHFFCIQKRIYIRFNAKECRKNDKTRVLSRVCCA